MRELTDHIVPGDSANHQLKVEVLDEPGQGGACHHYVIEGYDAFMNPVCVTERKALHGHDNGIYYDNEEWVGGPTRTEIIFQNGPIAEVGVNGITHEALLAILIDRLRSFQTGPYAGSENAMALTDLENALEHLQLRTKRRIARGVEGTHAQ